ncbi:MvdC/MvdD family ATP grasp protein [Micromonospora sp. NPDC047465]|uniref:MvdC/MvdD family ATP grasp protein n=1 Tax=Micromonospora sp. NPDC047465 TaxID=3154813 RepID=UPI0033DD807A
MILILTQADDVHADAAEAELGRRDARWLRFDPAQVPTRASIAVHFADGRVRRTLHHDGGQVDLDEVSAVWFRRPGRPVPPAHLTGYLADFVAGESATFVGDAWETLDALAVPAPRPVVQRAQYKLRQLQLAAQLGFELPETVAGNHPDAVLDLFNAHGGHLISKQVGLNRLGGGLVRYTEPVRHRDLVHVEGIRQCPVIVQSYVPKRLELRVTVVGERVYAAAIDSQHAHHTRYDWRRYDDKNSRMCPWDLPGDVAARCVELTRRLGLRYGAIDLVLTPDDRYVFLEINPSGQYLWVEDATGLPITAAIVDLLMSATATATTGGNP